MKTFLLFIISLLVGTYALAHEGHGDAKAVKAKTTGHTSMAVSDKYEYVLKYPHVDAGATAVYSLYINEFLTNKPVRATQPLKLRLGKEPVAVKPGDAGIYSFSAKAVEGAINLQVELSGTLGPDLVLVKDIDPTREVEEEASQESGDSGVQSWLWIALAALGGAILTYAMQKLTTRQRAALLVLVMLVPTSARAPLALAHEGHGSATPKTGGPAADGSVAIAKESQFLFGMLTERVGATAFAPSEKVFGTIVAAPQGQTSVIAPQAGSVTQLFVQVGANVKEGQPLAVLEQIVDAQTQAQLLSERNSLSAELAAARADYERLQKVADIASAREVSEAQSRYNRALTNSRLFAQTASGSGRRVTIKSPISGVVQNFAIAQGATVEAGASLFTVTDLSRVFVEAQVFDNLIPAFAQADSFTVTCSDPARKHISAAIRLVSLGQSLNPTNQSQRVLFEIQNADEDFKLGEFVDVRAFQAPKGGTLTLPTASIVEIDGKPAVFIKESPEGFKLSFVRVGENNGSRTQILSGIEAKQRVLVSAAFQARMIYQAQ